MKENEAIKELKENIEMPFGSDVSHEASKLAIKALEEIQQYREIGTVDDFERLVYLKERYENETYDYCGEYGTEECPKAKEIQREEKLVVFRLKSFLCERKNEYQKRYNRAKKQEKEARKVLEDEPDREDIKSDLNHVIKLQDRCNALIEFIDEVLEEYF